MDKENKGVECKVATCKYHNQNNTCGLKKIIITSDMNEKHYCDNFEERPDVPEF